MMDTCNMDATTREPGIILKQLKPNKTQIKFFKENISKYDISNYLSCFKFTKKQLIYLLNSIKITRENTNLNAIFSLMNEIRYINSNKYELLKLCFQKINETIKVVDHNDILIENISYSIGSSINVIFGYSIPEVKLREIINLIKEAFPANIGNVFISRVISYKQDMTIFSKEFIEEYGRYFSPRMLLNQYSTYINDKIMTEELKNLITQNIATFIKDQFGEFANNFIDINITTNLNELALVNSLDNDHLTNDIIREEDPIIKFNRSTRRIDL